MQSKGRKILDPDEFQAMIGNVEPSLANFFDQLYIGTNPHNKSHMTNTKNRRRLVLFCYFLAGSTNKISSKNRPITEKARFAP